MSNLKKFKATNHIYNKPYIYTCPGGFGATLTARLAGEPTTTWRCANPDPDPNPNTNTNPNLHTNPKPKPKHKAWLSRNGAYLPPNPKPNPNPNPNPSPNPNPNPNASSGPPHTEF